MTRIYTKKLLEMLENESINKDYVINACLNYMSEDEVKEMMELNDIINDDYENEE